VPPGATRCPTGVNGAIGQAPLSATLALVDDERQRGSPCSHPHWHDQRRYICLIFSGEVII